MKPMYPMGRPKRPKKIHICFGLPDASQTSVSPTHPASVPVRPTDSNHAHAHPWSHRRKPRKGRTRSCLHRITHHFTVAKKRSISPTPDGASNNLEDPEEPIIHSAIDAYGNSWQAPHPNFFRVYFHNTNGIHVDG